MTTKQPIVFEMETADPDDFLTLCWLADHPDVDLLAVLLTPGSRDQCQLARYALVQCGRTDIPLGSFHHPDWWKSFDGQKRRVSGYHYKVFPGAHDFEPGYVHSAAALLVDVLNKHKDATVLVGSAPRCLDAAMFRVEGPHLARWVQQGFFAGDNLVASEHRLPKFDGRLTCPSYNPGGAPNAALRLLSWDKIERRLLVSKNVCHGVRWTPTLQVAFYRKLVAGWFTTTEHERKHGLSPPPLPADWQAGLRIGLRLMLQGLAHYQKTGTGPEKPEWEMDSERAGQGKALHDLVAAACVLDESVCTFKEVEIYRERGEWGAKEQPGTNTWISVAFDREKFVEVLAR